MNIASDPHMEWLQDKLADYEAKLDDAESIVAKLRPIVTNLRGSIDALLSDSHGPIPDNDMFQGQPLSPNGTVSQNRPTNRKHFAQGNQNPLMPARCAAYADVTLLDAAAHVINNTPSTVHADEVTNHVYHIENRKQFALAKHTMASELYRGAKKGLWDALGENRYRRK